MKHFKVPLMKDGRYIWHDVEEFDTSIGIRQWPARFFATIVEKYLDILEKMFVIINLRGFSRNLRKEVSKNSKYYFVDLGLRNALIRNFNPLHLRADTGAMFENFCVVERMKVFANQRRFANFFFWRTYDQKEIDLIEEHEGKIKAYEFKFSDGTQQKKPGLSSAAKEFTKTYENSGFETVSRANLELFLKG